MTIEPARGGGRGKGQQGKPSDRGGSQSGRKSKVTAYTSQTLLSDFVELAFAIKS